MKTINKNLRDMLPSLLVVFAAVFIWTVQGQFLRILFLICAEGYDPFPALSGADTE